jgi:hypothetical protein
MGLNLLDPKDGRYFKMRSRVTAVVMAAVKILGLRAMTRMVKSERAQTS